MKKALLALICLVAMMAAGTSLKAQEVTIVLNPGWNWISYPSTDTMDIATAFGSFTPEVGDIFKSKWGMTTYIGNGQWRGSLSPVFYPGYGYHYKSNRQMPVVVTFNVQQPTPQVVVTTSEPMLITAISAMGGGEVTTDDGIFILAKGLCWATHENPTTNEDYFMDAGSGVGSFTGSMTDLNISTTYYVRAYAVTADGTTYGDQKTFTTRDGIPTLTTAEVTDITGATATCGGNITDNGGLNVTDRGVCWSTSPNPAIDDIHILEAYNFENGLIPTNWTNDVTYPWIMSQNTSSGNYCIKSGNNGVHNSTSSIQIMVEFVGGGVVSFDALCQGEGTTTIWDKCIFSIDGEAQFIYGAEVSGWNHYNFFVTAGMHTFEWSYTKDGSVNPAGDAFSIDNVVFTDPDIAYNEVSGSTGSFSSSITCLSVSTTYYVRAYATTIAGTGYGDEVSFTTPNGIPEVTTAEVTNIFGTIAICGGSVTNDGGLTTARGVCWGISPNPTVVDQHTSNGMGVGDFVSTLTGLTPNTTYYVRAYASTTQATTYGEELSFTTLSEGTHEYVDLGLPSGTLWATCNVGAATPEDYGAYFAWGETQPKSTYNWNSYQYCNGSRNTLTKYCNNSSYGYNGFIDTLTILLPEDDAATANWGDNWRLPTKEEWQELINNTTCTWTTQNGVNGRLFTASNGNTLFLPAAGDRDDSYLYSAGSRGFYWSSSLYTVNPNYAWYFNFYSGNYSMNNDYRCYGRSVRPVCSSRQN